MNKPVKDRILDRVTLADLGHTTECWVTDRATNIAGYPQIRIQYTQLGVHHAAYMEWKGAVPDGLQLDHLCHDGRSCAGGRACPHRRCCNPDHLEPVTPAVNASRTAQSLKTKCIRGHELTGRSSRGKRYCVTCAKAASRAWYERKRKAA